MASEEQEELRTRIRDGYSAIANKGVAAAVEAAGGCCRGGSCCGSGGADARRLAENIGYTAAELAASPEAANMGLSCGNPTALAALKSGEVVLDLGAGGGFDVFIAGAKVGPAGRVIGIDMTPEMVSQARRNIKAYRDRTGLENVEFRLGEIEHLPVADAAVDVVISNCVVNLSTDKPQVWKEIARVLKRGGRVAISDLALLKPLPESIVQMVEALVGCVAGAVLVSATERMARAAGLVGIELKASSGYIDAMSRFEDPLYQRILAALPEGAKASDYLTSLAVSAQKP